MVNHCLSLRLNCLSCQIISGGDDGSGRWPKTKNWTLFQQWDILVMIFLEVFRRVFFSSDFQSNGSCPLLFLYMVSINTVIDSKASITGIHIEKRKIILKTIETNNIRNSSFTNFGFCDHLIRITSCTPVSS